VCTVSCCCFSASFRPKDEEREIKPGQQKILSWTSLAKPATLPNNNGGLQPCSPPHTHAATARLSIRPCARMRQAYEVAARRAVCHAAAASCRLRIGKVGKGVARPRRLLRPLGARHDKTDKDTARALAAPRCHLPFPDTALTHHPPLCTRCENVFDQDHQIHVITLHQ